MEQSEEAEAGISLAEELAARDNQIRLLREAQLRLVEVNKTLNTQVEQQMTAKREALRRAEQAEKLLQLLDARYKKLEADSALMVQRLKTLGDV